MADYPYPDDPGKTHYPGCWEDRGHHACAVAEIERLRAELERLRAEWSSDRHQLRGVAGALMDAGDVPAYMDAVEALARKIAALSSQVV